MRGTACRFFFFLIYFFKARPRESIHEIRAAGREKKKKKKKDSVPRGIFLPTYEIFRGPLRFFRNLRGRPSFPIPGPLRFPWNLRGPGIGKEGKKISPIAPPKILWATIFEGGPDLGSRKKKSWICLFPFGELDK